MRPEDHPLYEILLRLYQLHKTMYTMDVNSIYIMFADIQKSYETSKYSRTRANFSEIDNLVTSAIDAFLENIFTAINNRFRKIKVREDILKEFEGTLRTIFSNAPMATVPVSRQSFSLNVDSAAKKDLSLLNVSKISKRSNYPKNVTHILKSWLENNLNHPYPDEEQKLKLSQQTGLCLTQINNWFINARRRILPDLTGKHYSQ